MTEREKIITGLDCCSVKQNCSECPWEGGNTCIDRLHLSALELLKDEPLPVLNVGKYGIYFGDCPHCGKRVTKKNTSYCPYCGKRVKWDDSDNDN